MIAVRRRGTTDAVLSKNRGEASVPRSVNTLRPSARFSRESATLDVGEAKAPPIAAKSIRKRSAARL
jgi:hypothetical protein